MQLKKDSFSESWIPGFCIFHQFWSPLYQSKTAKILIITASLSCATIARDPLWAMPRRRNISAFCPSNRSLFVRPRILFWPPRAVKLTTRCTKGRPDAQRCDLVFPRVPRQWLWWKLDVCERYRGGCRETVRGDFCFDFCDPMRGFASQLSSCCQRVAKVPPGSATHPPHMESSMHGTLCSR